jgi:hypothetical protein
MCVSQSPVLVAAGHAVQGRSYLAACILSLLAHFHHLRPHRPRSWLTATATPWRTSSDVLIWMVDSERGVSCGVGDRQERGRYVKAGLKCSGSARNTWDRVNRGEVMEAQPPAIIGECRVRVREC